MGDTDAANDIRDAMATAGVPVYIITGKNMIEARYSFAEAAYFIYDSSSPDLKKLAMSSYHHGDNFLNIKFSEIAKKEIDSLGDLV